MSTPRHGLWQAQQVAARWLCLCLSSHFTESGATIECCFHGVFTVCLTSDNDPYVVFGVSGTPCFSRSSNDCLYSCPDVSGCIGSAEAMLVFADADLAPASLLYVFWRSNSVIWSQIRGLFFVGSVFIAGRYCRWIAWLAGEAKGWRRKLVDSLHQWVGMNFPKKHQP